MISPLSSYLFPSYSPFHRIGLPCFQSVTTRAPNMYSLICSGSVNAAHTLLGGAAMSVSAVATKLFTSPPSASYPAYIANAAIRTRLLPDLQVDRDRNRWKRQRR